MPNMIKINGTKFEDLLNGTGLWEKIKGKGGVDIINGGGGDDKIKGDGSDDTITGGLGNDAIDGGKGIDIAVYSGSYREYAISFSHKGDLKGTVTDLVPGRDGTDTLKKVEFLQFNDAIYDVENDVVYILNHAPVVTGSLTLAAIAEDSGARLITQAELLANSNDVDGDSLTAINLAISSGNGLLHDNGNETWTYTPASNDDTAVTFSYQVTDGIAAASDSATLDITPVNDAPLANLDSATVAENGSLAAINVLDNDSKGPANESGQTLTVISASALHGVVGINGDGTLSYTPNADYYGADTISYTIQDDGTSSGVADPKQSSSTVAVIVTEVNDAPVAGDDLLSNVAEDSGTRTIAFAALTGNDSKGPANESGQALTVTAVSAAVGGTVAIIGGQVKFTPAANFFGPASFDYTVADDGTTNGAAEPLSDGGHVSFMVTRVNDVPVANPDSATVAEDGSLTAINVLGNDSKGPPNEFGQTLTVIAASAPHGVVGINGDGTLSYAPHANYNGFDTISYTIQDNGMTGGVADPKQSSNIVAVTINAVNDAPIAPVGAAFLPAIDEDAANPAGAGLASLTLVPPLPSLFDDAVDQIPGGSSSNALAGIAISGNETISEGTWQWSSNNGLSWTDIAIATDPLPLSDANALVLAPNTLLRFIPKADYNGSSPALNVHVIDDSAGPVAIGSFVDLSAPGSTGGTTQYSVDVMDIYQPITAINDAPVTVLNAVQLPAIDEDTANPSGETISSVVTAAFSDPQDVVAGGSQADTLAGIAISGNAASAAQGTWQWSNDDATWENIATGPGLSESNALVLSASTLIRFVPAPDYNGSVLPLTAHLIDGSAGPVANGSFVDLTALGSTGGTTPYSTDTFAIGTSVNAVNDAPVNTVPGAQTVAEDTFLSIGGLSVSDVDAGSALITTMLSVQYGTLTVASAGGAFAAVSDNSTATVTLTGSQLQINTTLAAPDNVVYLGVQDFNGNDTLTIIADDDGNTGSGGSLSDTDTIAIAVNSVEDAPIADDVDSAGAEDVPFIAITLRGDDGDLGDAVVSFTLSTLPPNGTLYTQYTGAGPAMPAMPGMPYDATDEELTLYFVPDADWNGIAEFQYAAIDNDGDIDATPATATITVSAVNDGPEIQAPLTVPLGTGVLTEQPYFNGFENPSDVLAPQINSLNAAAIFGGDPPHIGNFLLIESSFDHSVAGSVAPGVGVTDLDLVGEFGSSSGGSGGHVGTSFFAEAGATLTFDWRFTAGTDPQNNDWAFYAVDGQVHSLAIVSGGTTAWTTSPTITFTYTGMHTIGFGAIQTGSTSRDGWSESGLRIDNVQVTESTPVATATINDVSVSDVDAGGDPIGMMLAVDSGALALTSMLGLDFTGGDGDGSDGTLAFTGSQTAINTALSGGISYTAPAGTTSDTLIVIVNDLGHNGAGGAQLATHNIVIGAAPAGGGPLSTNEDAPLTIVNPFAGFSDLDGDTFNFVGFVGIGPGGAPSPTGTSAFGASLSVNAAGEIVYDPAVSAILDALDTGQSVDNFSYAVSDGDGGTATANLQVTVHHLFG